MFPLSGSRARGIGEPSLGNASIKPLHTCTSLVGLPPTPASRLSSKTPQRTSVSSELSAGAGSTQGEPFYRKNMFCTCFVVLRKWNYLMQDIVFSMMCIWTWMGGACFLNSDPLQKLGLDETLPEANLPLL